MSKKYIFRHYEPHIEPLYLGRPTVFSKSKQWMEVPLVDKLDSTIQTIEAINEHNAFEELKIHFKDIGVSDELLKDFLVEELK